MFLFFGNISFSGSRLIASSHKDLAFCLNTDYGCITVVRPKPTFRTMLISTSLFIPPATDFRKHDTINTLIVLVTYDVRVLYNSWNNNI